MFRILLLGVSLLAASAIPGRAQDQSSRTVLFREPRLQLSAGLEWRFDQSEEPIAFFPSVVGYVWPFSFLAIHSGISYRNQGQIYNLYKYSVFAFQNGIRLQVPNVRLAGFVEFDVDTRWYHGKTTLVPYKIALASAAGAGDPYGIWLTQEQTGLSAAIGLSHHLNNRAAIDFSLRKVWNHKDNVTFLTIPDPNNNGFYYTRFPNDVYNPVTLEIHFRYGL